VSYLIDYKCFIDDFVYFANEKLLTKQKKCLLEEIKKRRTLNLVIYRMISEILDSLLPEKHKREST